MLWLTNTRFVTDAERRRGRFFYVLVSMHDEDGNLGRSRNLFGDATEHASSDTGPAVTTYHDQVGTQLVCRDRKSTRLNSSHVRISYAVFCLKKKKKKK